MKPATIEWINKAESDHKAALILLVAADAVYDAVCFHAQQCAEKYLKAWLIQQGVDFPKVHDLEAIAKLCLPSLPEVESQLDDLRLLTSYAVEVRYPGISAQRVDAERCQHISARTRE